MIAIGRALMSNPDVLLCDELSLGLAPIVIKEIYSAIQFKIRKFKLVATLFSRGKLIIDPPSSCCVVSGLFFYMETF
jgi:ABC-type branched-subunit amino acid transport system ATPase component